MPFRHVWTCGNAPLPSQFAPWLSSTWTRWPVIEVCVCVSSVNWADGWWQPQCWQDRHFTFFTLLTDSPTGVFLFFLTEWNCWNLELPPDNPHTGGKERHQWFQTLISYTVGNISHIRGVYVANPSGWEPKGNSFVPNRVVYSVVHSSGQECHFALTLLNWRELIQADTFPSYLQLN